MNFDNLITKIKEAFGGDELLLQQMPGSDFPVNIYRLKRDGLDIVTGRHMKLGTFHDMKELEAFYETIRGINTQMTKVEVYR